jgi:hypothetical protein
MRRVGLGEKERNENVKDRQPEKVSESRWPVPVLAGLFVFRMVKEGVRKGRGNLRECQPERGIVDIPGALSSRS